MVSAAGGWARLLQRVRANETRCEQTRRNGTGDRRGEPRTSRADANYTAARTQEPGAGNIVTGGNEGAFQRRCAHCQNPCTEAGGEDGAA